MRIYEEQVMTVKYASLVSKKSNHSKPIFMISELIDNSIASWLKHKKNNEKLNILIQIDNEDKTLTIQDDAYGMNYKELENAIVLDDYKEGNELNKFGVGLKNSAFWFGQDLRIWTNNGGGGLTTSVLCSKHKQNEEIRWIVEDANDAMPNRGTIIQFSNCYDRLPNQKDFEAQIKPILERKFHYYINAGVNITFQNIYTKRGGNLSKVKYTLANEEIKSQIIPMDRLERFEEKVNDYLDNPKCLIGIGDKVKELAREGRPLVFEYDIKIGYKGPFRFTFGVQDNDKYKKNFKINYGLGTLQKQRYINIPYENVIELADYIRGNIKRIWALVDFGDAFELDNNKKNFDFGDLKMDFENLRDELSYDLEQLGTAVFKTIHDEQIVESGNLKENEVEIINALKEKINWSKQRKCTIVSDTEIKLDYNDVPIYILEESFEPSHPKYYFWDYKIKGDEIHIRFNINHTVFKPIIDNLTEKATIVATLYPLIAVIVLGSVINDNVISEMSKSKLLGKSNIDNHNYQAVMNSIVEDLISKKG